MVEFSWNSRSTSTSKSQTEMHQVIPPTTLEITTEKSQSVCDTSILLSPPHRLLHKKRERKGKGKKNGNGVKGGAGDGGKSPTSPAPLVISLSPVPYSSDSCAPLYICLLAPKRSLQRSESILGKRNSEFSQDKSNL